jgi:peroxiredoxin
MPALRPGDAAPDFELLINNRETVRLSSALTKGPVVLLAYVFDFSPG